MASARELQAAAKRLGRLLKQYDRKVVFAESCTGGLVSAALTAVPGISKWHCGSAVVYQVDTKAKWLGISPAILKKPGPVSRVVAAEMANRVLQNTPHADLAASVTGHLGPDSPRNQDGLVYIGVADRGNGPKASSRPAVVSKHRLSAGEEFTRTRTQSAGAAVQLRVRRQREAAILVIGAVCDALATE
jgi:PncC family amidohydrolase